MTNDRPKHRLNYQLQASIHFNCPIEGQYDVFIYRQYKKLHTKQIFFRIKHYFEVKRCIIKSEYGLKVMNIYLDGLHTCVSHRGIN